MGKVLQKITDSVGAQLLVMNSAIVKMKEEEILDMDKNTKNKSDEPR